MAILVKRKTALRGVQCSAEEEEEEEVMEKLFRVLSHINEISRKGTSICSIELIFGIWGNSTIRQRLVMKAKR